MGDKAENITGSQSSSSFCKVFNDSVSHTCLPKPDEVHPTPPTSSADNTVAQTNTCQPQLHPDAVLNNRKPIYYKGPTEAEANNINLYNLQHSQGRQFAYEQVDAVRRTVAGAYDNNIRPGGNPLVLNPGHPGSSLKVDYDHIKQANAVNPLGTFEQFFAGGFGGFLSRALMPGTEKIGPITRCTKGIVYAGIGIAALDMAEKLYGQANHCANWFNPTWGERAAETFFATTASIKGVSMPWRVVSGATAFGIWGVSRIQDGHTVRHSEHIDNLNQGERALNNDYIERSAQSMRVAINSYEHFGLAGVTKYTDPLHPDQQLRTESQEDSLIHLASNADWKHNKVTDHPLYTNDLDELRGGIAVKTAYAKVAKQQGTRLGETHQYILAPDRVKGKPEDYLDFGGTALMSAVNAKRDLKKCINLTRSQDGKTWRGQPLNAGKEIAGLNEVEDKEINPLIYELQRGEKDPNKPAIGHDIVGAFCELNKDAMCSAILPGLAGNNQSLRKEMLYNVTHPGVQDNHLLTPDQCVELAQYDRMIMSKQYRDLALLQLANLDDMGTANIKPYDHKEPEDNYRKRIQEVVSNYNTALNDYLYNAKNKCPDSATCANPDIAKLEYVAKVLTGKFPANPEDQELQAIANNLSNCGKDYGIQHQLVDCWNAYVNSCNGTKQTAHVDNPAPAAETTQESMPVPSPRQRTVQRESEAIADQQNKLRHDFEDKQSQDAARAQQAADRLAAASKAAASRAAYESRQTANPYAQYTNPNGQYGYPNGQYANPNSQYASPNAQYANPNRQYASPNGQYAYPNRQYAYPNGQYAYPNGQYANPNRQYAYPNGQYANPNGQYTTPGGQYPNEQQ